MLNSSERMWRAYAIYIGKQSLVCGRGNAVGEVALTLFKNGLESYHTTSAILLYTEDFPLDNINFNTPCFCILLQTFVAIYHSHRLGWIFRSPCIWNGNVTGVPFRHAVTTTSKFPLLYFILCFMRNYHICSKVMITPRVCSRDPHTSTFYVRMSLETNYSKTEKVI